ncbi:MAG: EamA/RhaT family transporter, partial [Alphaproteobacteria bacterium]|nr:EamA/RhaT family transporter [Alphaproteobacteria bacterium]
MPESPGAAAIQPRHFAMLAALSLSWGTSYLMIKVAVAEIPPLSLAAARLVLGAMVLYACSD